MFSGLESPWHLLIVAVIAVIVFGPKKLPELGRSLGHGIRGFKDAIDGKEQPAPPPAVPPVAAAAVEDKEPDQPRP
jgi:sec-independent protein translocase protein TatA